jgi:L-histidine N-alpha-methyltransferase
MSRSRHSRRFSLIVFLMQKKIEPDIFAPNQRTLWQSKEPSIWTLDGNLDNQDPILSILGTLLDQPRWLEPYHLYDEIGSQLFERICELPEYYLTRTEDAILAERAGEVIAAAPVKCIVELGAGSSKKTRHLLREQVGQRKGGTFAPIDVSLTSLTTSKNMIRNEFPQLTFHGLHARYEEGVYSVEKSLPTLFVFLGSSLGNFTRSEFVRFFKHLSGAMGRKDFLLLGVDRIKEVETLEKAYNDSQGVTADFIFNVFQSINRLSGSNFEASKMCYQSWYNPGWRQIEMYAVSTSAQEIHFPSARTSFVWEKGDKILVEISRKFDPLRLQEQLRFFGLELVEHFTDSKEWFSVLLFEKSGH